MQTFTFESVFSSIYETSQNIIFEYDSGKDTDKKIIIGKDALMLKKIGSEARKDIENMLDDKVNLKLWVKVRKDWQDNDNYLGNIKNKI